MSEKNPTLHFVVTYRDPKDGNILSLKAEKMGDSSLGLGFIAVSGFIFDSHRLVITPEEETMQKRLEDVKTLHLSIYSILSVQEMGKNNSGLTFKKDRSNLLMLPNSGDPRPQPPTHV